MRLIREGEKGGGGGGMEVGGEGAERRLYIYISLHRHGIIAYPSFNFVAANPTKSPGLCPLLPVR